MKTTFPSIPLILSSAIFLSLGVFPFLADVARAEEAPKKHVHGPQCNHGDMPEDQGGIAPAAAPAPAASPAPAETPKKHVHGPQCNHGDMPEDPSQAIGSKTATPSTGRPQVYLTPAMESNLSLTTAIARQKTVAPTVSAPVTLGLLPELTTKLATPLAGTITEVLKQAGDSVKAGEVIVRVTPIALGAAPRELKAPLDGVVQQQNAVAGATANPEETLTVIADPARLQGEVLLFQSPEVISLKPGMPATVSFDAFPGQVFSGTILRTAPTLDPNSSTYRVFVALDNKDGKLKPGLRGTAALEHGKGRPMILVPASAILRDLGKVELFVKTGSGLYERREVTIGRKMAGQVPVLSNLAAGEEVVTRGNYQLQYTPARVVAGAGTLATAAKSAEATPKKHVHGPQCNHGDMPEDQATPESSGSNHEGEAGAKPGAAHEHGPECDHDHEGEAGAKPGAAQEHGPECDHDHEGEAGAKLGAAHEHGPECDHDHEGEAGAKPGAAQEHGPECDHDHEGGKPEIPARSGADKVSRSVITSARAMIQA